MGTHLSSMGTLIGAEKHVSRALQPGPFTGSTGWLTLKCSATSQDSKAEKSRLVETPQKMRPTRSTLKLLKCFVKQPNEYVRT